MLEDLQVLSAAFLDEEVIKVFKHPTITIDAKKELVSNVLKEKVPQVLMSFVEVLIDNKRLTELSNITESYQNLLDEELGQKRVTLKTRYALTDATKLEVLNYLKDYYQKEIILTEVVDENQSNGILLTAGNEQLDLTLDAKLNQLINKLKG